MMYLQLWQSDSKSTEKQLNSKGIETSEASDLSFRKQYKWPFKSLVGTKVQNPSAFFIVAIPPIPI